jgi:predicted aspartyl protease
MSVCRFSVLLCLSLLVGGTQPGFAQQNFGVVQGRLAETTREVAVTGNLMPRRLGTGTAFTIPVSVNRSKQTWWVVDTGAPLCMIDPPFSQKLGLQTDKVGRFPITMLNDLVTGNFQCNGIACKVESIDELKSATFRNESGAFEKTGLVGVNLLSKYGAVINCRTEQIFLSPTGNLGMSREKYEQMGFTYVPMNVTSKNRLEVTGTLNGKEFSFFLDTGAYSTLLDDSIRNEVQLPFLQTRTEVKAPFANISKFARYSYGFATDFKLGTYDAKGARLGSTMLNWKESGTSHRFAGFIGIDFLYSRSAIIDIGGRALYLKSYSTPK